MSQPVMVYVTTSGQDEAARIGRVLVEERLAACVNILPPIRSFYNWDGELQDDSEVAFIAKTTQRLVDDLVKRVRELHCYTVPAIVALPIIAGNKDYLDWVESECR